MKKPLKLNLKTLSETKEPLSNANEEREACRECGLFKSQPRFLRPSIPEGYTRKALFIGESFTHEATRLLHRLCKKAKYSFEDVALAPVVRCQPEHGKSPSMAQIRACRPFLLQVINKLRPKVVIGFGSSALRILRNSGDSNVTKARGKEIKI
jgi:uracil-DNA glycosylase family 4